MKGPDTDMSAFESLGNVIVETSIGLVTGPEINDLVFLLEQPTEILNSYVHEKNLRPNTHVVSLAHLLFEYREQI